MNFKDWWGRILGASEILFPDGIDVGKVWFVGAVLSMVISWGNHHSVVLALFHALCSWLYVLFQVLCGG